MQPKKSKSKRLAKLRQENSIVYAKRTCHPRIGEEGVLLELLHFMGVPRGDREAHRVLNEGDPYRVYRRKALVDCLEWMRVYAKEHGGPGAVIEPKIGSVIQGRDMSPADSEPPVSGSHIKPGPEGDVSPECNDVNGTGESPGISDMSPDVGEGQQTFLDLI